MKEQKRIDEFFQPAEKKNPLQDYFNEPEEEIVKNSFYDKIANFFKGFVERKNERQLVENKQSFNNNSKFVRAFKILLKRRIRRIVDSFNFEAGVDILDDVSVLYRRNKVNKTILFYTNIVFVIFTMIGNQNPNPVVTIAFMILTFLINNTLKRIIEEKPQTLIKQQLAMYFGSVYIIVASLGVYFKLFVSAGGFLHLTSPDQIIHFKQYIDLSISQAGYILIYFSLVIVALYQNPKLLRTLFKWVLGIVTIIHLFVMYPVFYSQTNSILELLKFIFVDHPNVFIDIVLRTILLSIFYVALYSNVNIGHMMNNKRKEELLKRRKMEQDFKELFFNVFDVIGVFSSHKVHNNAYDSHRVAHIATVLGKKMSLNKEVLKEIYDYTVCHLDTDAEFDLTEIEHHEVLTDKDYRDIRNKAMLGSTVIRRLQLNQKAEDIVRVHFEKVNDEAFVVEMNKIQPSKEAQIILLAEMYDILRQKRNYKLKLRHSRVKDLFAADFVSYFDQNVLDRFLKYESEIQLEYDNFILRGETNE